MKRFVCFLLAMILIMGMVPATAVTAFAASERTTSDKAINILKEYEGFSAKVYSSGGKYYVGYGTQIDASKKDNYPNGIKEADALALLKKHVNDTVDKAINNFAKINNLDLTQYQHDALSLFSYNCGTAWMSQNGTFRNAVLQGKSGNEFINAIAQWHGGTVGGENFAGLIRRRLSEANMYLNNSYGYNPPANFTYVIFDNEGSKTAMAFNSNTAITLSEAHNPAEKAGYKFLGWYLNDAPVKTLDKNVATKTLTAKYVGAGQQTAAEYVLNSSTFLSRSVYHQTHAEDAIKNATVKGTLKANTNFAVDTESVVGDIKWVRGVGTGTDGKRLEGWVYIGRTPSAAEATNPKVIATATAKVELNIREGATEGSDLTGKTVAKDQTVNIYEIKVDKTETGNKSWGKVINVNGVSGWINLAYTTVNEVTSENSSAANRTGKIINTDYVNVRKDASASSALLTTLARGTQVTILETTMNGAAQWGRVKWSGLKDGYNEGWVYMYYVEAKGLEHSNPNGTTGGSADKIIYTGVVTSNINLNVRQHADIYANRVNSLPTGTKINIYETAESRNMKWGRIGTNQWVCLTYVNLTKANNSAATNTGTATEGTTTTQGTVTATTLDIYKNYNSNSEKLSALKKGDIVTILEKNTETTETGSRIWGRVISDGVEGWINLAYVDLKTVTTVAPGTGTGNGTSGNTTTTVTPAVISDCISVNVREAAGVYSNQITKLNNGTAVTVYEQITYDNAPWARIKWNNNNNEGWVCMYYVTLNAGGTVGSANTDSNGILNGTSTNTISATGFVNNVYLNVRGGAGLGFGQIGTLNQGAKVTIFEQAVADGMIWGRISYGNGSGWVCMSYITVESASTTGKGVMGTVARCFAKANVRSAPGTNNALVATVNVGSRVEVFETRTHAAQKWGRIAQGWVCMDYILLDSELPEGTVLDATTAPTETTAPATSATEETVNKDGEIAFKIEAYIQRELNVRNDASANSDRVGTVQAGLHVDIRALKNNGAELWGRIDQYGTAGWINLDKENATYMFTRYVSVEDQPIYTDPSTSSVVKGTLAVNEPLTITKVTTDGENVYGWVEMGIFGWIPMSKTSATEVDVVRTYKSGETVGTPSAFTGTTYADMNAYDSIGGSKVLFKMTSGVKVNFQLVKYENGKVWACVLGSYGEYAHAWVDLSKINYSLANCSIVNTTALNVRSSMDSSSKAEDTVNNIITELPAGTQVDICQIAFDGSGNVWARINGEPIPGAQVNGAFIMIMTAGKTAYVQHAALPTA